ncbi:MAG TPA: DUF5916 domain-containing protein [Candidatus Acidoferrales bacterium]|nr:DUF5916 domain-containing protein [Candidatus Acidoferrales bacterium]
MKPADPALRKLKKLLRSLAEAMRAGSLRFKICIFLAYAVLLAPSVHGRVLSNRRQLASLEQTREAAAIRVERAPRLDGTLNDPLWQLAKPIDDFRQQEPYEGEPATERTEVRILYSRKAVFFGIHCYDSQPTRIVATELRRDASQDLDDHFEILIDSNNDRRDAYLFETNPLGTQADGLIVQEQGANGEDFDSGWDGVWTSEARITSDGWTATVGIPFTTLNFLKSRDVVWGLNFKRFIRSKNEDDLWAAYRRTFGIKKVSQAGKLSGITDIGSGRLFIIKPYGLATYDKVTGQNARFPLTGGLDIKYGLRSNMVLNLTGNTDFADTDVDLEQFNLTPFKIFIPEKRQFFLENAGIFNFLVGEQDQLFFSRNIGIDPVTGQQVPVNGGAKLTGTLGRTEFGVLDVDTRSSGSNPYANYSVVRVKESLWGGSYIGAIGIDKRSGNTLDRFNQTGGVDARLVFFKDWIVNGHLAGTRAPGNPSGASDVGASLEYNTDWLDAVVVRRKTGPNFNPEVGFIQRVDTKETFGDATFKWRPRISGVRELQFEGFIDHAPDTHNVVQTQEWQGTFRAEFNNGGYTDNDIADVVTQRITTPLNIYKNIFIPAGLYHFARHQLTYGSGLDRRFTYNFFERFGGYYGGTLNEFRVRGNYRPTEKLSFAVTQSWNRFRLPVGDFSVDLASWQTNYSFNRFLTLTNVLQVDTANTQAVSANFRLRYNYRPDSDLFVIYNIGTQFASLAAANPVQVRENRFAVKYTYSFAP